MEDNQKNRMEFSKIMLCVAENFGGTISTPGMESRFAALSIYSIDQIQEAGNLLLRYRKAKFPVVPTIQEFMEVIQTPDPMMRISSEHRAEKQADIIIQTLHKEGRMFVPDFQDPITKKLMTNRWPYFLWASQIKESELTWWRKEFVRIYQVYVREMKLINYSQALPGTEKQQIEHKSNVIPLQTKSEKLDSGKAVKKLVGTLCDHVNMAKY